MPKTPNTTEATLPAALREYADERQRLAKQANKYWHQHQLKQRPWIDASECVDRDDYQPTLAACALFRAAADALDAKDADIVKWRNNSDQLRDLLAAECTKSGEQQREIERLTAQRDEVLRLCDQYYAGTDWRESVRRILEGDK